MSSHSPQGGGVNAAVLSENPTTVTTLKPKTSCLWPRNATARLGGLPSATRDRDRRKWRRPGGCGSECLATWTRPQLFCKLSAVLSAPGKHRRRTKEQNIGMASSDGLGLHRVTEASRVAGSGHVKAPSYMQLQRQRQQRHLLQARLVFCALCRLQSRGIAAKLSGSTAARRDQERWKRQAKGVEIRKWRTLFRDTEDTRELVLR